MCVDHKVAVLVGSQRPGVAGGRGGEGGGHHFLTIPRSTVFETSF